MYNDLYLDNLETELFIESTELFFDNIRCNNSISLLVEDGNSTDEKRKKCYYESS